MFYQEKGGLFSGIFKKSNRTADDTQAQASTQNIFCSLCFRFPILLTATSSLIVVKGESEWEKWTICQQWQFVWEQQQQGERLRRIEDSDLYLQCTQPDCLSMAMIHPSPWLAFFSALGERRNLQWNVQEDPQSSRRCSDWQGEAE